MDQQPQGRVPAELGLRVAVVEDQHRFVLHHRMMEKLTDDQIAVPLMGEIPARFSEIESASLDKGFHGPASQAGLAEVVDFHLLLTKGKRSAHVFTGNHKILSGTNRAVGLCLPRSLSVRLQPFALPYQWPVVAERFRHRPQAAAASVDRHGDRQDSRRWSRMAP